MRDDKKDIELKRLQKLTAELQESIRSLQKAEEPAPAPAKKREFPVEEILRRYGLRAWEASKALCTPSNLRIAAAILAVAGLTCFAWSYESGRHGLQGDYFLGTDLRVPYKSRLDKAVNFDWGWSSPWKYWATDRFSVRWSGYLHAPMDGKYEFTLTNDDGARLWIGKKLIVDDWKPHSPVRNPATVELKKGWYPLRLEYCEYRATASVRLAWETPASSLEAVITSDNLCPTYEKLPRNAEIRVLE